MRLYFIRHAQSANNALPEHLRVEDPAITPLGHRQAAALAEAMESHPIRHLITSPFRRALETAEHLRRRLDLSAEVWVDLHEQGGCYSGYERRFYQGRPGLSRREIEQHFPRYAVEKSIGEEGWWASKEYESAEAASARARRLWQRIGNLNAENGVGVAFVTHADFKSLLMGELARLGNWRSDNWQGIWNTAVTIVDVATGQLRLVDFNSVGHLPEELLSS
jgi:2,3-bisphosphoglycerate-dependent phosphoglycerate mutase